MPKIKVSKIVPKGFIGITLWPFGIFVSDKKYLKNKVLIRHENIHWEQQKELLGILFYILYGIEWLVKYFKYNSTLKAYKNLSSEREANKNEKNRSYLVHRKRYNWLKYIFIK